MSSFSAYPILLGTEQRYSLRFMGILKVAVSALRCPRCEGPMYDLDGPTPDPEPVPPFCVVCDGGSHYECRLCTCTSKDHFSCIEFPRVVPGPDATPRQLADPKLDCADRRRRMSESSMNARINSKQQMNWLVDAARVSKLVAGGNIDLAPIFWIRLYGILHEIYGRVSRNSAFAIQIRGKPIQQMVDFLKAVDELSALFSADERVYIQYRRDVESHPIQVNYEFKVDSKGRSVETFQHKIMNQKVPVTLEEFTVVVRRLLHTVSQEVDLARMMAERCLRSLAAVVDAGARVFG